MALRFFGGCAGSYHIQNKAIDTMNGRLAYDAVLCTLLAAKVYHGENKGNKNLTEVLPNGFCKSYAEAFQKILTDWCDPLKGCCP